MEGRGKGAPRPRRRANFLRGFKQVIRKNGPSIVNLGALRSGRTNISVPQMHIDELWPDGVPDEKAERQVEVSYGVWRVTSIDNMTLEWRRGGGEWRPFGDKFTRARHWDHFVWLRREDLAKGSKLGDEDVVDANLLQLVSQVTATKSKRKRDASVGRWMCCMVWPRQTYFR